MDAEPDEGTLAARLNPDLTAHEISRKFAANLGQTEHLEIEATTTVSYRITKGVQEVKKTTVVVEVAASMTPDSFHFELKKRESPLPELILSLEDGMISEKHWYPTFGYRTQTYPPSQSMRGTGIEWLRRESSLFAGLGTQTCATGEFTGTWVGGSPIGESFAIDDDAIAVRLEDTLVDGVACYYVRWEGYRSRDEDTGMSYSADGELWYDSQFRLVARRAVYTQIAETLHDESYFLEVHNVYRY